MHFPNRIAQGFHSVLKVLRSWFWGERCIGGGQRKMWPVPEPTQAGQRDKRWPPQQPRAPRPPRPSAPRSARSFNSAGSRIGRHCSQPKLEDFPFISGFEIYLLTLWKFPRRFPEGFLWSTDFDLFRMLYFLAFPNVFEMLARICMLFLCFI